MKNIRIFYLEIFPFLFVKFSIYLNRRVFIMTSQKHAYTMLTPLNPTFYVEKLGFTGVNIIFLFSAQKHRFEGSIRTASPREF